MDRQMTRRLVASLLVTLAGWPVSAETCAELFTRAGKATTSSVNDAVDLGSVNRNLREARVVRLSRQNGPEIEFVATDGSREWKNRDVGALLEDVVMGGENHAVLIMFAGNFPRRERDAFYRSGQFQALGRRGIRLEEGSLGLLTTRVADLRVEGRVTEPEVVVGGVRAGWWRSLLTIISGARRTTIQVIGRTKGAVLRMADTLKSLIERGGNRSLIDAVVATRREVARTAGVSEEEIILQYRTEFQKVQLVEAPGLRGDIGG
jgi:hypothetical protein